LESAALSGIRWTTASTVFIGISQLLQVVIVGYFLKPADLGLMSMTMVVIGFGQMIADLGFSNAIVQELHVTERELGSLFWTNLLVGGSLFALTIAAAPAIAKVYAEPRLIGVLSFTSVIFLLGAAGQQHQVLLRRELRFKALALIQCLSRLFGLAATLIGAKLGLMVFSLVLGTITGVLVQSILAISLGASLYLPQLHLSLQDVRRFWGFGAYQVADRCVNYLAGRADQFLIGKVLGADALGYYGMAFNVAVYPSSRINPAVTSVAFPVLAKLNREGNDLLPFYLRILRLVCTINAPLCLGLSICAPVIFPLFFTAKWNPCIPLIQVLSVVALIQSVNDPIGAILLAKGRPDLGFKWNLIVFIIQTTAIAVLIRHFGTRGIAVGLLFLNLGYFMCMYKGFVSTLLRPCFRMYAFSLFPLILAAAATGFGTNLLLKVGRVHLPPWVVIPASGGGGVFMYLGMLRVFAPHLIRELRETFNLRWP
jgi:lipopolysaccharide exporter